MSMKSSSVLITDNKIKVNISDKCLHMMMNAYRSPNNILRQNLIGTVSFIAIVIILAVIPTLNIWIALAFAISISIIFKKQYTRNKNDKSKYNYCARHPVYTLIEQHGWRAFYNELTNYVNDWSQIVAKSDLTHPTGYQIYRFYGDTFPKWTEYNSITRGLILQPSKQKVIGKPFVKFFSYHEFDDKTQKKISELFLSETAENKIEIFDKMDGSLGILFYCEYLKQWRIVTKGSFQSEQSIWASNYLHSNCSNHNKYLIKGHTYLMEIICSKYKVLIDYPFEGLVMLAGYNDTGFEYNYKYLCDICKQINGFRIANKISNLKNIDEVKKCAWNLDGNKKEGLIVKFSSGFRVKFYGEEYHQLWIYYDKLTLKNIEKQIIDDGMLTKDDMLKFWPYQLHVTALKLYNVVFDIINGLCMDMSYELVNTNHLNNSELGKMLKRKMGSGVEIIKWRSDVTKGFIFKARSSIDAVLWENVSVEDSARLQKLANFMLNSTDWRVTLFKKYKKKRK
eukprot:178349_1